MPKATKTAKPATKKATKAATPKRVGSSGEAKVKAATQLETLLLARDHMRTIGKGKFKDATIVMDEIDNTVPGYISTQSLALNWIVGNGGVPMTRIMDVTGEEGTGKSTIGDHLMAEVQRRGGHAWLWDTENARDNRYQEKIGIARKRAGQIDIDNLEDGFEYMIELLGWHVQNDQKRPGILLWDTPAGTPTRAELDPEKKGERFGPAKIIRAHLRTLNQLLHRSNWIFVIINQTYMGQRPNGDTYRAAYGGGGIPFYASTRLEITHPSKQWRSKAEKEMGLPPIGQTVWVKAIKNRVGSPHRARQIFIKYGQGIDNSWDLFHHLCGAGLIVTSGSWYTFDRAYDAALAAKYPFKWQGGEWGLEAKMVEHPELFADLVTAYEQMGQEK